MQQPESTLMASASTMGNKMLNVMVKYGLEKMTQETYHSAPPVLHSQTVLLFQTASCYDHYTNTD